MSLCKLETGSSSRRVSQCTKKCYTSYKKATSLGRTTSTVSFLCLTHTLGNARCWLSDRWISAPIMPSCRYLVQVTAYTTVIDFFTWIELSCQRAAPSSSAWAQNHWLINNCTGAYNIWSRKHQST